MYENCVHEIVKKRLDDRLDVLSDSENHRIFFMSIRCRGKHYQWQ